LRTASTVLAQTPADPESLSGLLVDVPTSPDRVIVVTVGESPAAWTGPLQAHLADRPVAYVDVRTPNGAAETDDTGPPPVATVSSPADLGSLGTALTDLLGAHEDDQVALVLSSLSDMLGYVDRELLFKFVFTLGERVRNTDAVAFYHLDPDAGDEELRTLFAHCSEAVLTETDDGLVVEDGRFDR
jgi:hypothetical protein